MKSLKIVLFILLVCGICTTLTAQAETPTENPTEDVDPSDLLSEEQDGPSLDFGLGIGFGAETFHEYSDYTGEIEPVSYQYLSFSPDFNIGKFGIGLDFTFHFRFTTKEEEYFVFRTADWYVEDGTFQEYLELYLPLIRYVRWGVKGDPFYVKVGTVDHAVLGNGFIMSGYANTHFRPEKRLVGLSFDLDGNLFNFPYVGFETFIANFARFDVFGSRVFTRPLAWLKVPVIKDLQIGGTFAMDRVPDTHYPFISIGDSSAYDPEYVIIGGIDFRQPILGTKIISLAAYGDLVFQPGVEYNPDMALGGMIGAGGRLFGFLIYGIQIRFLGNDFQPVYFDRYYDLYRQDKYEALAGASEPVEASVGGLATIGFSFLDDRLVLQGSMDWTFGETLNEVRYPHIYAIFSVTEGLLPFLFLNVYYDKRYIDVTATSKPLKEKFFGNAVMGADINFKAGPAVLTLGFEFQYNPTAEPGEDPWTQTAQLKSSIELF